MSSYIRPNRQLATIMFSDIVGYTSIMGTNEDLAFELVKKNTQLHKDMTAKYKGRLVKEMGDGILCAFSRAEDAVQAAHEIQSYYIRSQELNLRIGLHMGEIIEEGGDVFGDAVNIASRIQTLGSPKSVLLSDKVYCQLPQKSNLQTVNLGTFELKNVEKPIEIHALATPGLVVPKRGEMLKLLESRIKKGMLAALIILSLLSAGLWFNYNTMVNKSIKESEKSIAVLPFSSLNQKEEDFLTDGLTEDIIMQLSKISAFSVISKSGVEYYKNSNENLSNIAKTLNVNYILEGKIQRVNNRIKINTNLIQVSGNKNIWAESYERDLSDIFELQSDIAQAIAISLSTKLTEEEKFLLEKKPTQSFTAYEYYMKGRNYYYKYNVEDNLKAIQEFKNAIEVDRNFALAWAGLGDAFSQNYGRFKMERIWIDSAKASSQRAISLDSNLSEAYKALATAHYYNGEYEDNFNLLQKAVELNPNNSQAVGNLATSYFIRGELDEAIQRQKKAAGLNPKNYIPFQIVGWTYRLLKDYENAIQWLNKSLEIQPESDTYEQLGLSYLGMADTLAAKSLIPELLGLLKGISDEKGLPLATQQGTAAKIYESAGIISFFCEDFDSSMEYFQSFIKYNEAAGRDPLSSAPIYLGYLHLLQGNNMDAEVLLEGANYINMGEIKQNTDDPDHFFKMAMIYAIYDDKEKCMEYLIAAKNMKWVDIQMAESNPVFYHLIDYQPWKEFKAEIEQKILLMKNKELSLK